MKKDDQAEYGLRKETGELYMLNKKERILTLEILKLTLASAGAGNFWSSGTVYLKADAARDGFTNDLDTLAVMAVICLPLMTGERVRGAINIEGFRESNPVRKEDFLLMKTIKCLLELSLQIAELAKGAAKQSRNRK